MQIDPDRFHAAIGAVGGGALFGLVQFGALALSNQPVTRFDYARLAINVACATLAGVLIAWFLAKAAVSGIPWAALREPAAIGFGCGAFGWELMPLIYRVARNRVMAVGGGAGGGQCA